MTIIDNVETMQALLASHDYVADRSLATTALLAINLDRPLFLEGEAGVGKTEIAKVLAAGLNKPLIRLQCYEGLEMGSAAYEWNYTAQMLRIRLAEGAKINTEIASEDLYTERYLIERPLLAALRGNEGQAPVLLIDELDRTDEPFEAFLLEILSDWQISIPEMGVIKAASPPVVVITSNRTREIHDAIKRRCFYYWVDYPDAERELDILKRKAPHVSENFGRQIVAFVQQLRKEDLFKLPGVAETLDWAHALTQLDVATLEPHRVTDTLGVLLKYQDDISRLHGSEVARIINDLQRELATSDMQ